MTWGETRHYDGERLRRGRAATRVAPRNGGDKAIKKSPPAVTAGGLGAALVLVALVFMPFAGALAGFWGLLRGFSA